MKHQTYLKINNTELPLPNAYALTYRDIEADTGGETEVGTIQRDVIRHKIASLSVDFTCSPRLVKKLTALTKSASLQVEFLDTESLSLVKTQMYIDSFAVKLLKDTSYQGLWEVSFSLEEY